MLCRCPIVASELLPCHKKRVVDPIFLSVKMLGLYAKTRALDALKGADNAGAREGVISSWNTACSLKDIFSILGEKTIRQGITSSRNLNVTDWKRAMHNRVRALNKKGYSSGHVVCLRGILECRVRDNHFSLFTKSIKAHRLVVSYDLAFLASCCLLFIFPINRASLVRRAWHDLGARGAGANVSPWHRHRRFGSAVFPRLGRHLRAPSRCEETRRRQEDRLREEQDRSSNDRIVHLHTSSLRPGRLPVKRSYNAHCTFFFSLASCSAVQHMFLFLLVVRECPPST